MGDLNKELNNQYRYGECEEERESKYLRHQELCDELNRLYISKNKEYGDSFGKAYKDIGIVSAITQIYHKVQRLVKVYDKESIEFESLRDNLIDTSNYCLMCIVEMERDRDENGSIPSAKQRK